MKIISNICRNISISLFLVYYEAQNNITEMSFLPFWVSFRMEETPSLLIRLQVMVTLSSLTSLRCSLMRNKICLGPLWTHNLFKFYNTWNNLSKRGSSSLNCWQLFCTILFVVTCQIQHAWMDSTVQRVLCCCGFDRSVFYWN